MNYKQLRNLAFPLHRYIGLVVGLVVIVIGLTGSLLVFYHEMDHVLVSLHTGHIIPQENRVSMESVLDTVKAAYADRPELKLSGIGIPLEPDVPYEVGLESPDEKYTQAFVNPYTGNILFSRVWNISLFGVVYKLHYELLAGKVGLYGVHPSFVSLRLRIVHSDKRNDAAELEEHCPISTVRLRV